MSEVPPNPQLSGPQEPRSVVSVKEGWGEYTLDDGTVLRVKGVVIEAKRIVNQWDAEGNPVYVTQLVMVQQVKSTPDQLIKPEKK